MIRRWIRAMLLLTCVPHAASRRPRFEPIKMCDDCISRDTIVAPGVGFDLTVSYGTATIRLHDNSSVNVGKFDGGSDYIDLMKRLSSPAEDTRSLSRSDNVWDEFGEIWRRWKRLLNKRRGLPATPDVGILGNLIKQLRSASEETLGQSISAAAIARPNLPRLTQEDLSDAMEYSGLRILRGYNYFGDISETSAAFAGMGQGLCEHYTDIDTCEDEDSDLPWQYILALGFTRVSLSLSLSSLTYAHSSYEIKAVIAWDLGLDALNQAPNTRAYWSRVRSAIRDMALESPQPITTLLLLGEEGSNAAFLDAVRDALHDLYGPNSLGVKTPSNIEPLYVAAKGTAEFAKRFQESPWNCKEPKRCRENREPLGFSPEAQSEL